MNDLLARAARLLGRQVRRSSAAQRATFARIYRDNAWGDSETASGPGSTQARGAQFEDELVATLDTLGIRSIVDAPCGDCNWMRRVLARCDVEYTGIDIVDELIARNSARLGGPKTRFIPADMTRADLPAADLVLCRDGLVHLSYVDARAAIRNFRRSGSRYLLATTFVAHASNQDVPTGGWRPVNLEAPPFRFPSRILEIDERCTHSEGRYHDKRLGLWALDTLEI